MKRKFFVWGSSGHAKVLWDILQQENAEVSCLFDVNPLAQSVIDGVPLFGSFDAFLAQNPDVVLPNMLGAAAIGGDRGQDRVAYINFFESLGICCPVIIHGTAFVSSSAFVASGCHVLVHANVGAGAQLGAGCIVNSCASVDHECVLGEGVHIAPGAIICGCVEIGDFSMIGAGAVILPRVRVGSRCVIGAGAVVTRSVPDNAVIVGVPGRRRSGHA